jgi:hypothetical protein
MELRAPNLPVKNHTPSLGAWKALLVANIVCTCGVLGFMAYKAAPQHASCEHQRSLASQLKAAGATQEASALYEQYVQTCAHTQEAGTIALSLADMHIASGHYDRALRWYYEAQHTGDKNTQQEAAKRIVEVLERLGRVHAANAALAQNTTLGTSQKAKDDPIVAEWDGHTIHRSDVIDALNTLPPALQDTSSPQKQQAALHRYVAETLLWQKAQKMGYDQKPEVLKAEAQMHRHLVTQHFIEKELIKNIHLSESDLKTYYEAHKDQYKTPKNPKPSLDTVKQQVERDLRQEKIEDTYSTWIQEQFQAAQVKLYPEHMASHP